MGEFCCLVCAAVGEKVGKRHVNCVGLVQHANTVTKTKWRGAHRDFGRVVCGVLGWDIDKLPGVLEGKSSVRDGGVQVKEDMQKQTGTIAEVGPHRGVGVGDPVGPDKGDLMDCMGADANTD
ncbi:uncharacterized protein A4U43_C05F18600 [Asparagus officinalis]|uniref:Uncharacterized protein n=2 Tax=Asparagus officinalis TaxID=4686 RepID=A0A5P1ETA8_ASPOF|nr:uncharacterized protein A4U43_C05F18600 [Asparagus officinalis]